MKHTPRFARLSLALLLALLLAACSSTPSTTTGSASTATTPAAITVQSTATVATTSTALSEDTATSTEQSTAAAVATTSGSVTSTQADVIMAAKTAQLAAKSYRATVTIANGNEPPLVETAEYVAPDRFHMAVTKQGTAEHEEMIFIGSTTYMRMNGRPWQQMSMDMNQMIKQFRTDPKLLNVLGQSIHDVKLTGSDTLDGKAMDVYQYSVTFQSPKATASLPGTYKLWIGKDDHLPYKEEGGSTITVGGKSSQSHIAEVFSDYNATLQIEAPQASVSATADTDATDATDAPTTGDATDTPDDSTAMPDSTDVPEDASPTTATDNATTVSDSYVNPLLPFNDCGLVTADDARSVIGDAPIANPKNGATDMRDVSPGTTVVSGFDSFCAWVGGGPRQGQGYRLSYEVYRADKATTAEWSAFWTTLKDQATGGLGYRDVLGIGEDAYYQLGYLYFKQGRYVIYLFITTPATNSDPDKTLDLEKGIATKILSHIP